LLALLAYLVALAAKPSAIALPLALLLLDIWPLGRLGESWSSFWTESKQRMWTVFAEKIPFGLMAVLVAGLTFVSQLEVGGVSAPAKPLFVRMGEAAIGYMDYLRLFFWPKSLCVLYFADTSAPDTKYALSAVCVLAAVTVVAIALRGKASGVLLGWLWFLGLLSPLMGIVPFGRQSVADRYLYIPQLGLIAMALLVATLVLRRVDAVRRRIVTSVALVATLLLLGWLTYQQSLTWENSATLWSQALKVDPGGGVAHNNYAQPLDRSGQVRAAEFELRVAGKCQPSSLEFRRSLCLFLVLHRRYTEAAPLLEKLIAVDPMNMRMHAALVTSLRMSGQTEAAERALAREEAIRGRVFLFLGTDYLEEDEWAAAGEQLRAAWAAADGVELSMHKRPELAPAVDWVPRAERALGASPISNSDSRSALRGMVFALQNRWPEAEVAFAARLKDKPDDNEARWRRAVSLRRIGRVDEAEREFAIAATAAPKDAAMLKAWAAAGGVEPAATP
jgi:Tfp pilus assembly protein PilF